MEENRNNFKKSGNGANVLADIVAENLGADRYGADRNHINLDDALRNSREYVSPVDVGRAEDDTDGEWGRESAFSRDLGKNIERNRARREAGMTRLPDADRDAKIDYYIKEFGRQMDARGCDGLQFLCSGYDVRLIRVPEEGAELAMSMNGKRVYVHPDLKGEEVSVTTSRAEISKDLLEKMDRHMLEEGTMRTDMTLEDGHTVSCSADIKVDGKKAVIDQTIGENECVIDPGGRRVSRGLWDEAYEHIEKTGKPMWAGTAKDGTVFECGIQVRVDGKDAVIDPELREGESGGKYGPASISKTDWDRAYRVMMENGTKAYGYTTLDGSAVVCRLNMRVNGEEASIDSRLEGISTVKADPCIRVGKGLWERAREEILGNQNPSRASSRIYDAEGHKIEARMSLKVDGEEAFVNRPFGKGTVRETRDGIEISRDIYDRAVADMDEKRQTIHMEKLEDGREIRFKRDGKMKMYTPDGEIRDADFRDAVAEIGRMDDSKGREIAGRVTVRVIRETGTQITRSATIGALQWATLRTPAAMRDSQRSNIAHIMSMAFQEMERGMAK